MGLFATNFMSFDSTDLQWCFLISIPVNEKKTILKEILFFMSKGLIYYIIDRKVFVY